MPTDDITQISAVKLIQILEQMPASTFGISIEDVDGLVIANNRLSKGNITVNQVTDVEIIGNHNVAAITVKGGTNVTISDNHIVEAATSLSTEQRQELIEALKNPESNKSRIIDFIKKVSVSAGIQLTGRMVLVGLDQSLVALDLPDIPSF